MPGYIHLYTGNGKGKTTAALGMALRAAGAGKRVFIAQFVKGMHYSELESLKRFDDFIVLKQYGRDCFIYHQPEEDDKRMAMEGLSEVEAIIRDGDYDMVILDEVCIALFYQLFDLIALKAVIMQKPPEMEIVLTGRYAPSELFDIADLVTEMRELKHYYQQGVQARKGIEF
jgi:cob(I)alamin adenosyltransferase